MSINAETVHPSILFGYLAWLATRQDLQGIRMCHVTRCLMVGGLALVLGTTALGKVLTSGQLITPLAAVSPAQSLNLVVAEGIDPTQPIWVSYSVYAISASDDPEGMLIVQGIFEGIATPIDRTIAGFYPRNMTQSSSAGTIGDQLTAEIGQRSREDLIGLYGPELVDALEALNEKRGAILTGIVVKTLPPIGTDSGTLNISIERAEGFQPVLVKVVAGQGDVPAELQTPVEQKTEFRMGRDFGRLLFFGLVAYGLYWLFKRLLRKT